MIVPSYWKETFMTTPTAMIQTSLRLPPDLYKRLQEAAEKREVSKNDLIIAALDKHLGR
jgi:predicted transcriptional regulator